jgi:hypothetical protein
VLLDTDEPNKLMPAGVPKVAIPGCGCLRAFVRSIIGTRFDNGNQVQQIGLIQNGYGNGMHVSSSWCLQLPAPCVHPLTGQRLCFLCVHRLTVNRTHATHTGFHARGQARCLRRHCNVGTGRTLCRSHHVRRLSYSRRV